MIPSFLNSCENFLRKYSAKSLRSPCRSRSGGMTMGNTESLKKRSSRNFFCSTASCRSRLVAATMRISTSWVCTPPMRSKLLASRIRSIFDWTCSGSSPISSKKIVPLSASSNLPMALESAPVYDPLSCPKSSFSTRVSGMAAQFTATKECLARGLS